jgi:hypothetical protein
VSSVSGKLEQFPGIFYRQNKPIGIDEILVGHEAVNDAAELRSAEEATRSALSFDRSHQAADGERLVEETEVEVIQEVQPGQKPTGKEVKFGVGVSKKGSSKTKLPGV